MAALLVVTTGIAGCRTAHSDSKRSLAGAAASPEALAERALAALAANDLEGMKSLRLTKAEFCRYVFPELPAAKLPNVSCDWVWDQATLKSMAGMKRVVDASAGRKLELVSVRFTGEDRYASYRVLKNPVVTVRDPSGAVTEERLFGSVLELDGQYKLFSFVVD